MRQDAYALVYEGPGLAAVRPVTLPGMGDGMVEVATRYTALSRGTERLVFQGLVPESEWERMRAPFQEGAFPFPVRYGYAAVGRVEDGPDALVGRDVFCLYPHQTRFRVPAEAVIALPDGLAPQRAVLAANMETALNAIWDARLRPGARVLVVGAGLLGRLVTDLLLRRYDLAVSVTDVRSDSVIRPHDVAVNVVSPAEVPEAAFDVAIHTSATEAGLETALNALAFEGRVIELSWYGDIRPRVALGGAFHSRRLTIQCSQVGHVAPTRRASTTYRDRLTEALALLTPPHLDHLITGEVPFADLPKALPDLLAPGAPGIATRVSYPT